MPRTGPVSNTRYLHKSYETTLRTKDDGDSVRGFVSLRRLLLHSGVVHSFVLLVVELFDGIIGLH